MNSKRLRIGVAGFGTVGSGLVEYILKEGKSRYELKRILVRNPRKVRKVKVPASLLTTDFRDLTHNPEVDVVVEVIGGREPAYTIAMDALSNGKHFITANKILMVEKGEKLFKLAEKKGVFLGYRGTIVGLHPILHYLRNSIAAGKRIKKLYAVLNGTCNFILDEMERTGADFKSVLKVAQELGYAEPDPTLDVEGWDTLYKLNIVLYLLYGIRRYNIHREGITHLDASDLRFASELGYRIKLLGMLNREDGGYSICVRPALIPQTSLLAKLKGAENGVEIEDETGEISGWMGQGAGVVPTRIAIMQDLEDIYNERTTLFPSYENVEELKLLNVERSSSKYYIRIQAKDKPGVLAKISRILGRHNINISAVIQKESGEGKKRYVPVIILVDRTPEENMNRAFSEIKKLDCVSSKGSKFIRVAP